MIPFGRNFAVPIEAAPTPNKRERKKEENVKGHQEKGGNEGGK
jgi:hypothetical protein